MTNTYTPLFEPFTLPSGITLKNRLMVAPMTTWSSHDDGTITDDELAYIRRRSREIGTFITSCAYVINHGKAFPGQWSATNDSYLPSLTSVADAIHSGGAKAILQIHHGGRACPSNVVLDTDVPLSASAIPSPREGSETPRAMTEQEINDTIHAYGNATRLAIAAGYDGVEIHGANTYLIQQFFSPHSNRRDDEWGGTLEKRLRFPLAVVASVFDNVKQYADRPFIVGYRFSPEEPHTPGITLEDTMVLVDALADTGMDYLHVSSWGFWHGSIRDENEKRPITTLIKEHVGDKIPIVGVGSVVTPAQALDVLGRGIEFVALGRAILKDPDWVLKVKAGKEDTIMHEYLPDGQQQLVMPTPLWKRQTSS